MCCFRLHFYDFIVLFFQKREKIITCREEKSQPPPPPPDINWSVPNLMKASCVDVYLKPIQLDQTMSP